MEATTLYPGSIGELIQGNYKGIDVLVSCPVNLYTKVRVFESKDSLGKKQYIKSALFLENLLKQWGYHSLVDSFDIEINSQLPRGKGFASSTADLCAAYYSLLKLFNKEFNEKELVDNCIRIEPTDSIIFKELTIFDYKKGQYSEKLGKYVEFYILVFEGKNIVNTVEFNYKQLPPHRSVEDLIEHLAAGIKNNSIKYIAEASSESIIRNQHRLRYDILPKIIKFKDKYGGLGFSGAHSGDMISIIFDDEERLNNAFAKVGELKGYKMYKLKTLSAI